MTRYLKKLRPETNADFHESSSDCESEEMDEKLQELFSTNQLQNGIYVASKDVKRQPINNTEKLKSKFVEIRLELPWVERLDIVAGQAPLAPELADEEAAINADVKKLEADHLKNIAGESIAKLVKDDFKREALFYRQAQAAVMSALPKLAALNIRTRRPEDYFAQMAKTDDHMQKVRQSLVRKQQYLERRDKVRKLREMKKMGKEIQREVLESRRKEKKELLAKVKKYRKGKLDNLDLDGDQGPPSHNMNKAETSGKKGQKKVSAKRDFKDKRFGYGGKKRGMKRNTAESSAQMGGGFKRKFNQSRKSAKGKGGPSKRLGKSKRQSSKQRKK